MEIIISYVCGAITSVVTCTVITKKLLKKYNAVFCLGETKNGVQFGTLDEFIELKKSQHSAETK